MNNADVFKTTVEGDLKKIQECKIDLLIFQRSNDNLCSENNKEIKRLTEEIESLELSLENNLQKSGEKKIDTSAGWCAYRVMPDSWEYDEEKILLWCKDFKMPYYYTKEMVRKLELKKAILNHTVTDAVPGIFVTPQAPKFSYKLNGGL